MHSIKASDIGIADTADRRRDTLTLAGLRSGRGVGLAGAGVIGRPPDQLPDQDREAAVAQMASLIARYHAARGRPDDDE